MSDDVTEELDMSWIDVAVTKIEADEMVIGYSDGFEGFVDGPYLHDSVEQYDAPTEPGVYRWSGFKVGSWDEGDAMRLTGGIWTPYRLSTPSPDSGERMRGAVEDLERYTSHSIGCALYQQSWANGAPRCSCGLDAVRAALQESAR